MIAHERVERAAFALKVFPLPAAVLFPQGVMPLHIFEARYRALVRDALATDKVLALAQLQEGWEDELGLPSMHPVLCAGLIIWHEELPDGRFNILLQGVCRARILEERDVSTLYRQVRVQLLPDVEETGEGEDRLRRAVFSLAGHLSHSFAENLLPLVARSRGGALADVVASAIIENPERRQELLCELDPQARLEAVLDDVGEMLARVHPVNPSGQVN